MEYHDKAIEDAMRFAGTPAGQQLLNMLQQSNNPALQQAMQKAAEGDFQQAKQAMSALLQDPQIKKLLEQMGR